jgi:hypothetical protein
LVLVTYVSAHVHAFYSTVSRVSFTCGRCVCHLFSTKTSVVVAVVVGQGVITVVTSSMIDLGMLNVVVVPGAVLVPLSWKK